MTTCDIATAPTTQSDAGIPGCDSLVTGYEMITAATSNTQTLCEAGEYQDTSQVAACVQCPVDEECDATSTTTCASDEQSLAGSVDCHNLDYDNACPGGEYFDWYDWQCKAGTFPAGCQLTQESDCATLCTANTICYAATGSWDGDTGAVAATG